MSEPSRKRFAKTTLVLSALALAIASVVSPPEPFTLLLYAVSLMIGAVLGSYLLVYGGGFDALDSGQ